MYQNLVRSEKEDLVRSGKKFFSRRWRPQHLILQRHPSTTHSIATILPVLYAWKGSGNIAASNYVLLREREREREGGREGGGREGGREGEGEGEGERSEIIYQVKK